MARRLVYLIFIFLTFYRCVEKEVTINNYGSGKNEPADRHAIVELNNIKTYDELISRLETISCQDSIPKIIIHNRNSIENIFPVFDCHPAPFDPKGKFALSINDGKIYLDDTDIEVNNKLLPQLFKDHFPYFNKYNNSNKPDFYIVIIQAVETEDIKLIRPLLLDILEEYNRLESEAVLNIAFWYRFPYVPPPTKLLYQKTPD